MQATLTRIGNSRGIRLPRAVIEQCGFSDRVDLRVVGSELIVAQPRRAREGWKEAALKARREFASDRLLLDGIPESEFTDGEWTW